MNSKVKKPVLIIVLVIVAIAAVLGIKMAIDAHHERAIPDVIEATDGQDASTEETAVHETAPVSIEATLDLMNSIGASAERAQNMLVSQLVYMSESSEKYEAVPIRSSIEHNNYNWNYLDTENGMWRYDDGETVSHLGIDVSSHQGEIDWEAVASQGVEFAIIRVAFRGYGDTGSLNVDERGVENIRGALAAGLKVGVYVFSQAMNDQEAIEEADLVLSLIDGYQIDYPVVFDLETLIYTDTRTDSMTSGEITHVTQVFCDYIREHGYTPAVYGNMAGFCEKRDLSQLMQYDIWFAQYFETPFYPYRMEMYQYSESGSLEGIDGPVDMNISFVDYPRS